MANLVLILILLLFSTGIYGQAHISRTIFDVATIAARNGDHLNAIDGFRNALRQAQIDRESDDALSRIHYNIGVCLFQMDQPAKAIVEFRDAIRLDPRYERAYYSLGMAALQILDLRLAEEAFEQTLRINDHNGEAWFDLAFVHIAKNDSAAAMSAFKSALKYRTVDTAVTYNNIGVLDALEGKLDDAERSFELAIEASGGKLREASDNLAACRSMRGERAQMISQLRFTEAKIYD